MTPSLLNGIVGGRAPVDSSSASSTGSWKLGTEPVAGASFVAWLSLESGPDERVRVVSLLGTVVAAVDADRIATTLLRGVVSGIKPDGAVVFDGPERFDVPHLAIFQRDSDPENSRWELVWIAVEGEPIAEDTPAYAIEVTVAHHLLAAHRSAERDPSRAHALLEIVFSRGRAIPTTAFFIRARVWAGEKQWSKALADLDTALLRDDIRPTALLALRGRVRRAIGDLAGAASDLEASLQQQDHAASWLELAGVHEDAKQPAKAIDAYGRALALKPDHSAALLARGRLHRSQGELDMALSDLDRVHLLPDAAFERGLCHKAKGDFRTAETELKKARDAKVPGAVDALLALDRERSLRARR